MDRIKKWKTYEDVREVVELIKPSIEDVTICGKAFVGFKLNGMDDEAGRALKVAFAAHEATRQQLNDLADIEAARTGRGRWFEYRNLLWAIQAGIEWTYFNEDGRAISDWGDSFPEREYFYADMDDDIYMVYEWIMVEQYYHESDGKESPPEAWFDEVPEHINKILMEVPA